MVEPIWKDDIVNWIPIGWRRLTVKKYRDGYLLEDPNYPMPGSTGTCFRLFSFIEGVALYLNNKEVFVIKGEALEEYEYDRRIRFIEDLKGNFPKNIDTFFAWGAVSVICVKQKLII